MNTELRSENIRSKVLFVDLLYIIAFFGLSPLAWIECVSMWNQEHLQFFPLAWIAYLYLTYKRGEELQICSGAYRWSLGIGVLMFSLTCGCISIYINSFWFGYVASLTLVTSWSLTRFGKSSVASLLATATILFVTVRIPSGYDTDLIHYLQYQSSRMLSSALDAMGIVNLPSGNVFEIQSKKLFVDEACSGVDSLYALLACSLFIFLLTRAKWIVAFLALPLVFVWASCGNFIRLLVIVLGLEYFEIDLSKGTGHTALGLLAFSISFACDLAFINAAAALFQSTVENGVTHSKSSLGCSNAKIVPWGFNFVVFCVMVAFCGFGALGFSAIRTKSLQTFPKIPLNRVEQTFKRELLPEQIDRWQLISFQIVEREANNTMGHYSAAWVYDKEDLRLTVSVDFPFRGFHRLDFCYTSTGWRIINELKREKLKFDSRGMVEVRDMVNQLNQQSHLVYTLFEADGTPAPWKGVGIRGFERFEQSILDPITYQVQCNAQSSRDIEKTEKDEIQKIHALISQELIRYIDKLTD